MAQALIRPESPLSLTHTVSLHLSFFFLFHSFLRNSWHPLSISSKLFPSSQNKLEDSVWYNSILINSEKFKFNFQISNIFIIRPPCTFFKIDYIITVSDCKQENIILYFNAFDWIFCRFGKSGKIYSMLSPEEQEGHIWLIE